MFVMGISAREFLLRSIAKLPTKYFTGSTKQLSVIVEILAIFDLRPRPAAYLLGMTSITITPGKVE